MKTTLCAYDSGYVTGEAICLSSDRPSVDRYSYLGRVELNPFDSEESPDLWAEWKEGFSDAWENTRCHGVDEEI